MTVATDPADFPADHPAGTAAGGPADRPARRRPWARHVGSSTHVEHERSVQFLVTALVTGLVGLLLLTTAASFAARLGVNHALSTLDGRWLPAQRQVAALQSAYIDEETGERGFLLTGDGLFLQPYDRGEASAARLARSLRRLVAPDAPAVAALAQVVAAHATWQRTAAAPEIASRRAGPIPQSSVVAREMTAKRLFGDVRASLAALSSRVGTVIATNLRSVSSTEEVADVVAGCTVALALLAAALALPVTRRVLTRPLDRLLGQLQTVAGGGYRQPIASEGAAELVAMAQAAEQMRQSLVQRSDELVAAQQSLTLRTERDRFAADLHDRSVQRMFALGLSLSSLSKRAPDLAPMILPLVDETDRAIRELRGIIFDLTHDEEASLERGIDRVLRESSRVLGFTPDLAVEGSLHEVTDDQLTHDLLAVLRESLSNVVRHAKATRVDVVVTLEEHAVRLVVSDNGVGPTAGPDGNGLRNMRDRAARLRGNVALTAERGGGTRLEWSCPLPG